MRTLPAALASIPFLIVYLCVAPIPAQETPLDLGLEEEVDVRLVLVDFLVLDKQNRTVPDLTADDFEVVVWGRSMRIASLDLDCPVGAADDPLPGDAPLDPPPSTTGEPRRMVIVFDYLHMSNVTETIDNALAALDTWASADDEHMVVSLGNVVRIESPWTRDLDEIRWSIERMRNDPDLYAGNYSRLTETRYFDRIQMLFDLLERIPGRKSLVMFSGPFQPDGFTHDPSYRSLSALSTAARTSIYAVDSGGLRVPTDPLSSGLGGPPMLRRLAIETGGRMVADTNLVGLVYAKAQRDLSCTYTIGFYDNRVRLDKSRRMTLRIKELRDTGLRVVYPEFYVIRSPEEKRESLFRTAAMMPQMFDSPEMSIGMFVVGPHSMRRWRTVLAIQVRPDAERRIEAGEEWLLRGMVRKKNGTILHSFRRRVPMPATDDGAQTLTLFQTIHAAAGNYIVSAVLSDPEGDLPLASARPAVVPTIPRGKPFLVGPVLGVQNIEDNDPGSRRERQRNPEFEPLMEPQAAQGDALDTLTLVCIAGSHDPIDVRALGRVITTWDGDGAQHFDPVSLHLDAQNSRLECHKVFDRVATAALAPGRYEMTAVAETTDDVTGSGSVEFTIRPPATE